MWSWELARWFGTRVEVPETINAEQRCFIVLTFFSADSLRLVIVLFTESRFSLPQSRTYWYHWWFINIVINHINDALILHRTSLTLMTLWCYINVSSIFSLFVCIEANDVLSSKHQWFIDETSMNHPWNNKESQWRNSWILVSYDWLLWNFHENGGSIFFGLHCKSAACKTTSNASR